MGGSDSTGASCRLRENVCNCQLDNYLLLLLVDNDDDDEDGACVVFFGAG